MKKIYEKYLCHFFNSIYYINGYNMCLCEEQRYKFG